MKKNLFKKSMSVFLSILMLMSAWVFVPGEHQLEAEAASTVSPNGYVLVFNGNQADERVTSNYIVLCSDGQAGNTSCGVFQYNQSEIVSTDNVAITLNVVYSSHGSNIEKSQVMVIPVDVGLYPDGAGVHKNTAKFNEIFKSGYANSSSGYLGGTPAQDVYDYFGVTADDAVGTIYQPTSTTASTISFDVTDAVKEAKSKGKNPCFLFVMTNGYTYNNSNWSDIRIHNSTTLSWSSPADLKGAIDSYESSFTGSRFNKNVQAAYNAYNNAKRYYDAVVYGGVAYNASVAQGYINTLNNALGSYNDTYTDHLNQTFYSRNGSAINKAYTKNLIWNGYDFSWDITTSSSRWGFWSQLYFHWAVPNTIIGITEDRDATFPVTTFFFSSKDYHYVRYIIAGSGTNGNVVGTNVFSPSTWKVSTNTHTTSGWAAGADGWGDWAYDSGVNSTVIPQKEVSTHTFRIAQNTVYQASSYMTADRYNIGVNSSNLYNKTDFGMTWGISDGGTTDYHNFYASDSTANQGHIYAVYMEPYRVNYNNWATILPNFNYKNYNGYTYSSATAIATDLDSASAIQVNQPWYGNEAYRKGDISSDVSDWANRINNGAKHLANAKADADRATKITNKYVDLTNAISASDSIYKNGQSNYTYATWAAFANAYEAAREHMAALNPTGENNQYNSTADSTEVANLATALNNARNALTERTYEVTYENLFSLSAWEGTASATVKDSSKGTMTVNANAGTIKFANANTSGTNADDFCYSVQTVGDDYYTVDLDNSADTNYILNYTSAGGSGDQVYVYFWDANGNAVNVDGNANVYSLGSGNGNHTINFRVTPQVKQLSFRFGARKAGETITLSKIALYEKTQANVSGVLNWTARPVRKSYTYNSVLGASLDVPARTGYTFNGWYKADGTQVTDGTGAVVSSLQGLNITEDLTLYSRWIINKYTVTWANDDGTVIETDENVEYGAAPSYDSETPVKAATAEYTYTFKGWDKEFVPVTEDVTYTATFDSVANKHTIKFVNWDGTELQSGDVKHGELPVYNGAQPTKADNEQFVYTFSGWSPEIAEATEDATYTAQFTETEKTYTITWKDGDGKIIKTEELSYGATPVYSGETPKKTATAQYTYTFYGWPETVPVTADKTYTAIFYAYTNSYTITWLKYDDTELDKATYNYGTIAANVALPANSAATYDADGHTTYNWPEIADVTADASYKEVGTEAPHEWKVNAETDPDGWKVTVEPSCYAQGTKERTCSVCGYTESGTVDATGEHVYGNWTNFNANNHKGFCTTSGCTATTTEAHSVAENSKPVHLEGNWHVYTCEKCGENGAMVGNAFNTAAREACYDTGITYAEIEGDKNNHSVICICGNTKTASHNWVEDESKRVDETCTQNGYKFYNCPDCSATREETTIASHDMVAGEIVAPTCITNGYTIYTCSNCTETENRDIAPATGVHTFTGEWTYSDEDATKHIRYCSSDEACDEYEEELCFDEVTYGKITGNTNQHTVICECGREKTAAHKWSGWVADPANTTDENGKMKNTCADCGYEWVSVCEYEEKEDIDSTCTVKGHTTYKCKYCSNGYTVQKSFADHKYEAYVSNNNATCKDNATETAECAYGCGETNTREIADSTVDHKYETYVSNNNATCQKNATETANCAYGCGETDTKEIADSTVDHKYETYVSNNDATCQKNATETAECEYSCGTEYTREIADSTVGHKYETYVSNDNATCKDNATETASCAYGCGETDTREIADSTVGHKYEAYVSNNNATCKDNATETASCAYGCGAEDTREVADSTVDHKYETYVSNNDATCKDNATETASCAYGCGETDTREIADSKLPHTEKVEDYKAPTCTSTGSQGATVCSECGEVLAEGTTIPMLDHEFGTSPVRVIPASCIRGKVSVYKCNFCEETKEVQDSANELAPHTVVAVETVEPTCDTVGYSKKVCSTCKAEVGFETIPALGHADKDGDGSCDGCDTEIGGSDNGQKACTCICHKEGALMKFIYKILSFFWKIIGIGKSCPCGAVHY